MMTDNSCRSSHKNANVIKVLKMMIEVMGVFKTFPSELYALNKQITYISNSIEKIYFFFSFHTKQPTMFWLDDPKAISAYGSNTIQEIRVSI